MQLASIVAAALLAQAAEPPPAAGAARPAIHVEAPEASWDAAAGEARLSGGVLVTRGGLRLRAPGGRWVPATGHLEVEGGVLLVEGARAVVARSLRGEVGGVYEAEAPSVFFVDDPAALASARTPEEAERSSRRRLTLHAEHASGSADGGIALSAARMTLCSCAAGSPPSWELRARGADVRPGERAILSWPVLWITPRFLFVERPVPVLAFPWLYVPLGERQSGLLLPEIRSTGSSGLTISEPLFLTLGRSADATLWGGWAFGRSRAGVREGKPSVRGFVGALELRWAPAAQALGRVRLDWLQDLDAEPGGTRGARVAISGQHAQRVGERGDLRIDLELAGDPFYARDFTSDVLLRDATYRRSSLLLSRVGTETVLEAGGAWLLPLTRDGSLAHVPGLSFGLFGSGLPTFHRGPALSAVLLPMTIAGPLLAFGRAEAVRFGPLEGYTSDAGTDGIGPGDRLWNPALADAGQLDGRFEPGERLAATRAALRAGLTAPFAVGRWLRLAPFAVGAASGYAFDAASSPIANAWGAFGATAETEISRRFGSLRHSIVPRLAWRAGSGVRGGALPAFGYDLWDRAGDVPPGAAGGFAGPRLLAAAPPGSFQQGRASVETRLAGPGGELFRLEVGQDLDLRSRDLAETFATMRLSAGPVTAEGVARYAGFGSRSVGAATPALRLDDWTEVGGSLRWKSRVGYELHGGARSVGAGGSPAEQAGVDVLFDLRPTTLTAFAQANAGFRLPIGPASIGYDVLAPPRPVTVATCDATGTRRLGALHVQQQTASFVWDSPCRCFRASVAVRRNDCGDVAFNATIDLSPGEPVGALR